MPNYGTAIRLILKIPASENATESLPHNSGP
jgi:hypothetical protein